MLIRNRRILFLKSKTLKLLFSLKKCLERHSTKFEMKESWSVIFIYIRYFLQFVAKIFLLNVGLFDGILNGLLSSDDEPFQGNPVLHLYHALRSVRKVPQCNFVLVFNLSFNNFCPFQCSYIKNNKKEVIILGKICFILTKDF